MPEHEYHFKIEYCEKCQCEMAICPKCRNNCCNGGYGEVDGKPCNICPLAYQYQELYLDYKDQK